LPYLASKLAKSKRFDAIICLGAVVRAETVHFEYVATQTARGIANVALEEGIPVVFGVITTDTVEQAIERAGVRLKNRGFEAAMVAIELANLYKCV
jgi:6,7-dimethyl-8-ribityllumazine synthase